MPEPRPHGRDEVVAAVLDAAERLFVRHGPAQVSMRAVAQEARVNLGLIHRHIGTKDALVTAVLARFHQQGVERMGEVGGWDELVELVFTPTHDFYDYTHLLAWLLLEGTNPAALADERPPLDLVVERVVADRGTDPATARDLVSALLAMAYGWQLFGPYLRRSLGTDGDPDGARRRLSAYGGDL